MVDVSLSMLGGAGWQFLDNSGRILAGGRLYTYEAGSSTPSPTYTDYTGNTSNGVFVQLDSAGRPPAEIWLIKEQSYKFEVKSAAETLIRTYDHIPGAATTLDLEAFKDELADAAPGFGADLIGKAVKFLNGRPALAAETETTTHPVAFLNEGGRSGLFAWSGINLSALITLDTRQGIYVPPASDPTGASGAWVRQYSGSIDIRWFGAVSGTAVGDQKAAIQGAINVAQGAQVLIPIGIWRLDSGLSYATLPLNLVGEGSGAGAGSLSTTNASVLLANFLSGDVVFYNSLYKGNFKHFQVNSNVGLRSSGAGIHISGDGLASTAAGSEIHDVAFNQQYIDVQETRCVQTRKTACYHQAWANFAYINDTTGSQEPGGGYHAHNYYYGDTSNGTVQAGCLKTRAGYLWSHDNMYLGGSVGVVIDASQHNLALAQFNHDAFEEQDLYSVLIQGGGSYVASMIRFVGVEFSVINRPNYLRAIEVQAGTYTLENLDIIDPTFRMNVANASFIYINMQKGAKVLVETPRINHLAGTAAAMFNSGGALGLATIINPQTTVVSGTAPKYAGSIDMLINDGEGVAFASLPSCANGSVFWCPDGTWANPLAGGGTGSWAKRANSAFRGD